jgi:hypothetical protein
VPLVIDLAVANASEDTYARKNQHWRNCTMKCINSRTNRSTSVCVNGRMLLLRKNMVSFIGPEARRPQGPSTRGNVRISGSTSDTGISLLSNSAARRIISGHSSKRLASGAAQVERRWSCTQRTSVDKGKKICMPNKCAPIQVNRRAYLGYRCYGTTTIAKSSLS